MGERRFKAPKQKRKLTREYTETKMRRTVLNWITNAARGGRENTAVSAR